MFADLHLHSRFSDGTFAPEELVARGKAAGFAILGLTDHDTVEGCPLMQAACDVAGLEFIAGTELTAEMGGNEIHLLGYFIDINNPKLLADIKVFQTVRHRRIYEITERLNALNIPLRAESVFELASCRSPGRPHVARALVRSGVCGDLDEAFERFLKKDRPAWVPKFKISALDAMAIIHQAGGLAVLAHPGLNRTDNVIPLLVQQGLDGIECFHSKHSPSMSQRYLKVAEQYKLLVSGGSDCHGFSKGKPLIGTVKLPAEYVEKLKAARVLKQNATPPAPESTTAPSAVEARTSNS